MKLLTYTAGDERSHKRVGEELRSLKPGSYIIEVKRNRPVRSLSQNKYYWALLNLVATDTGYTSKEIENLFKMAKCYEVVEYPNGKSVTIPKDTHNMDTQEFTIVVNNLQQWIREEFPQVIIPRKEDLTYLQWMQIEKQYQHTQNG